MAASGNSVKVDSVEVIFDEFFAIQNSYAVLHKTIGKSLKTRIKKFLLITEIGR